MLLIIKLIKYYYLINRFDSLSEDKVRELQLKKFSKIFEHAKKHSPFYQSVYSEAGVMSLKIETWEDVDKVPVVNKQMMRDWAVENLLTTSKKKNLILHTTSGSTGEPFMVYQNDFEEFTAHVRVFALLRKLKYNPFKKIVMITRYENNATFDVEKKISLLSRMQKLLGVFQRQIISIYTAPSEILIKLENSNTHILWCTPSVLEMVCYEMRAKNKKIKIPYIVLTSETMSLRQHKLFKEFFESTIVGHYGMMECPTVGYEIDKQGFFTIFSDFVLVECINNIESNQYTPIVTNLINYTMPFIRYNTNDICESIDSKDYPNKKIGSIIGRIDDILDFSDGTKFVHHFAAEMFMDFAECEQYKFVQLSCGDSIKLQIKPRSFFSDEEVKERALSRWNKRFAKYPLEIEIVNEFIIDKNTGKFKNIEKYRN